jgi:hypothetical protein
MTLKIRAPAPTRKVSRYLCLHRLVIHEPQVRLEPGSSAAKSVKESIPSPDCAQLRRIGLLSLG